jgi:hypothetical protein
VQGVPRGARALSKSVIVVEESVMRLALAVILVAVLPALVDAQSSRSTRSAGSTLPPIGLPLPQIGLPLPSLGLPQRVEKPVNRGDRRSRPDQNHRRDGDKKGRHSKRGVFYVFPAYGWGWDYPPALRTDAATPGYSDEPSPPQEPSRPTGILWLDIQPYAIAQIYVDGIYVGTTEDVSGELTLEAGLHKIEIRAPGYETLNIDVKIERDRAITYRSELRPLPGRMSAEPPPAVAVDTKPATSKPIYIIPGCYMGNIPPKEAGLPATCDQSRATTIQP